MIIKVSEAFWREFGMSDPTKYTTVLACLYLGYGQEQMRVVLSDAQESADVRDLAVLCGLDLLSDRVTPNIN